MIIDAHVHLAAVNKDRTFEQSRSLLLQDLQRHGIDAAIVIPDNIPGSAIGDLPTCVDLLAHTPNLFLMGTIDIQTQGRDWIAYLEHLILRRTIVAIKIFPGHDPITPTDPRLDPVYRLCQTHAIPIVIHTGANPGDPHAARYNDPKYILTVADAFPDLTIVIAHLFWPKIDYCYELTRACPRIYYDLSALAAPEVIAATGRDRLLSLRTRIATDHPHRLIFGSDAAMCSRGAHLRLVDELEVGQEAREGVLGGNAGKIYNLKFSTLKHKRASDQKS
jgi:hypothetical protein